MREKNITKLLVKLDKLVKKNEGVYKNQGVVDVLVDKIVDYSGGSTKVTYQQLDQELDELLSLVVHPKEEDLF